jgi:hypothetical protein
MGFAAGFIDIPQGGKSLGRGRETLEERIMLKADVRKEEKRPGVSLEELYDIVRGGSNDENRAVQCAATAVSLKGRT